MSSSEAPWKPRPMKTLLAAAISSVRVCALRSLRLMRVVAIFDTVGINILSVFERQAPTW
jgi:hypothetical protein